MWEVPIQEGHWPRSVFRIVKDRVFSFVMVLGVGFLLLISLIVNVWLAVVGEFFSGLLPMTESVLQALTSVVSFVVIAGLFALIYKFLPDVDLAWREVAAGATLTSLLFSLGKLAIGLYLGKTGLASTYGAAGSLVAMLVWVTIQHRSSCSERNSRASSRAANGPCADPFKPDGAPSDRYPRLSGGTACARPESSDRRPSPDHMALYFSGLIASDEAGKSHVTGSASSGRNRRRRWRDPCGSNSVRNNTWRSALNGMPRERHHGGRRIGRRPFQVP